MQPVIAWMLLPALLAVTAAGRQTPAPVEPFAADERTVLLYHFDEGRDGIAHDSGPHAYHGELRGARWAKGKFGQGLEFDGKACVFRQATEALTGLRRFTVECWARQDDPAGRQFLVGKDVTFHFDLADGMSTSLSIYNEGGAVNNAEGFPHRHVGTALGMVRGDRWNHYAACYDGRDATFFLNGVLKGRRPAAKNFSIGANSRGLWIGCYVGMDYWFRGAIDEVRISDCVRYDPSGGLAEGASAFAMAGPQRPVREVRAPQKTGRAHLRLRLRKLHGTNAAGLVCLKPPGKAASIVGRYELRGVSNGSVRDLSIDVSDEVAGCGTYVVALEPTDTGAYVELTRAALLQGGNPVGSWAGRATSRRTFNPVVLAPLHVGPRQPATAARPIVLSPTNIDRAGGQLDVDTSAEPVLGGNGFAEWWVYAQTRSAYRVTMLYASRGRRPCDIVIDGADLRYQSMCALNTTNGTRPGDAMWEYQGTVLLEPGSHWIRLQDVLPDVYALRLDPVASMPPATVPFARYPVPGPGIDSSTPGLVRLSARSTGASTTQSVTLRADLEPFGRIRFRFRGSASGRMAALRAVDAKGDEMLIWRGPDTSAKPVDVAATLSFEGADIFDPGHVVQLRLGCDGLLDSHRLSPRRTIPIGWGVTNVVLERRDAPAPDAGADGASAAKRAMASTMTRLRLAPVRAERSARGRPTDLLARPRRPWDRPVVPEDHPLFATTTPAPVTRATLGYGLHTTGARDISADALQQYHGFYDFGDVCWPHIGILPQRSAFTSDSEFGRAVQELEARLKVVRDKGLLLFDIWGYVPFGEAGPTPQVDPRHHEVLTRVFGDRFLGYDNGEQDGRYIGSYSDRGSFTDRRGGWEDFVKWDEGICRDNMHFMNATGSLNYSHYYGDRGARTLGLETAQGLPSDTLMFAFLRGASRQYGRLTTQATSVWSRFGYAMYHDRKTEGGNGYGQGPGKGCSLALHRRLFLSSYTGGDSICGTETAQFTADRLPSGANELSPLGRQHLAIAEWARKHPDRGVMSAPFAFMLDFYNGWNMPRHLYRGDTYKVWGKLPYQKGDHQIDAVFRMVWPGYEDASYLRNERGFLCATPYGDIFDVLNNRCHPSVLAQYGGIALLGDVEMTPEVVRNLTRYVEAGGDLVLSAALARSLSGSLSGVSIAQTEGRGRLSCRVASGRAFSEHPYGYAVMSLAGARALLVAETGDPLMTVHSSGRGRVIVIAADHWVSDRLTYAAPQIAHMSQPHRLLAGVREILDTYWGSFCPVAISPKGLTVRTNLFADDAKRMRVALFNNEMFADWAGEITVRAGTVGSAVLVPLPLAEGGPRPHRRSRQAAAHLKVEAESGRLRAFVPAGDVAVIDVRLR